MKPLGWVLLCVGLLTGVWLIARREKGAIQETPIPMYGLEVVRAYPHDRSVFTQGLAWDGGYLYEGSGKYGESSIKKIDLETQDVLLTRSLDKIYFGEGIAILKDKAYQLTWLKGEGFVYEKKDFSLIKTFKYYREGWGLTHNGEDLIMSDGSSTLYFLNPDTFEEIRRVTVNVRGAPLNQINELEYVKGEVYANILNRDWIARININTGEVTGFIRAEGLLSKEERDEAGVMNGIAYDPEYDRLFLTGKLWPKLFEVRVVPKQKK